MTSLYSHWIVIIHLHRVYSFFLDQRQSTKNEWSKMTISRSTIDSFTGPAHRHAQPTPWSLSAQLKRLEPADNEPTLLSKPFLAINATTTTTNTTTAHSGLIRFGQAHSNATLRHQTPQTISDLEALKALDALLCAILPVAQDAVEHRTFPLAEACDDPGNPRGHPIKHTNVETLNRKGRQGPCYDYGYYSVLYVTTIESGN